MIFLYGLMIRQPLSSFSRVFIIGTLMETHSVHDDPVPYPEPWEVSWIVFWQWNLSVPNAFCTRYLILRSVVEWRLKSLSGISNQRMWRVEWLLIIRSKQDFGLFWSITKLLKVRLRVSVINSLISATKSKLPPGTPPYWLSPIILFFTECLVALFGHKYLSIKL